MAAGARRRAAANAWRSVGRSRSRCSTTFSPMGGSIGGYVNSPISILPTAARRPSSSTDATRPPFTREMSMNKLVRSITRDEIAAYRIAGVVLLRGILDLGAVNTLRRCLDEAVHTMGNSPSGCDLSALTQAIEASDQQAL